MDAVWFWLEIVSRWLHVGTAVVLVGGSVFVRYVLMPAAAPLPETEHDALRERVMRTWRKFVWAGIALLLVTGFYNFFRLIPRQDERLWHMLIGMKILLAMGVFFLASALAGRSAAFAELRRNNRTWLAVTILLAALVIAISGYAKVALPPQPAVPADAP